MAKAASVMGCERVEGVLEHHVVHSAAREERSTGLSRESRLRAMRLTLRTIVIVSCVGVTGAFAQTRPTPRPAVVTQGPNEILQLDASTALKAAALERRISAALATFVLLSPQEAQDLQQEMNKMREEREVLIQEAARKVHVEVGDPNEWTFDKNGRRFVRLTRPSSQASAQPPAR